MPLPDFWGGKLSKNYALAAFAIFLFAALILVWVRTGSLAPPTGNDAIWFHAGLFTLLLGKFVVEYRFTKPNDVFVNCMVVYASISTLSDPPNGVWWQTLRWGAFILGVAALALAWDPGVERRTLLSKARSITYRLVTRLGRAEVIFSFVFLLAIISYFELNNAYTFALIIFWGTVLFSTYLDLEGLLRLLRSAPENRPSQPIGRVKDFLAPKILYAAAADGGVIAPLSLVAIGNSVDESGSILGVVIGNNQSPDNNDVVISLISEDVSSAKITSGSKVWKINPGKTDRVPPEERERLRSVVGTVSAGTSISQLRFECVSRNQLSAGMLLKVDTSPLPTYYQVFDGSVREEAAVDDSYRSYTEGKAEQVGCWNPEKGGFDNHDWVAPERGTIFAVSQEMGFPEHVLGAREVAVGVIPKTQVPVVLNLNDLILFHSAILGVTGAGKSFLTYSLVDEAERCGIRTVCIDPTGDYQKYLLNAVMVRNQDQLRAFLDSDQLVAIIETSTYLSDSHPIEIARLTALTCFEWSKAHRSAEDVIRPQAKIQVILEEAHLLVPEFNFNPVKRLQDEVSRTAQLVLQSRKYGLGFVVVSQRTANVVKSILNQCNTIISFRAFDETGFDFLKNYMGDFHVRGLPNLSERQAIIVGKASKSSRPILVRFLDQDREIRENEAPDMEMPES